MFRSEHDGAAKIGERGTKEFWIPERRLLAAVLHRAVSDYTGPDPRLAEESAAWIFEDAGERHELFTFAWTCEQLELDTALISGAIACLPRQVVFQPRHNDNEEEAPALLEPLRAIAAQSRGK